MKKLISLTMALVLALILCACSGGTDSDESLAEKALIGSWTASYLAIGDEYTEVDDSWSTLLFEPDHTGVLVSLGEAYKFNWEFSARDDSTLDSYLYHMYIDGEPTTFGVLADESETPYGSLYLSLDDETGYFYVKN